MSAVLLSAHVILVILAIGPITLAANIFPRYVGSPPVGALAGSGVGGLAMSTGIFNLLWVAVTISMIVRPGSTSDV
jgi:hypothetical protein